jgi:hypothetical protein
LLSVLGEVLPSEFEHGRVRVHDEFESPKRLPPPRTILCDLAAGPSGSSNVYTPEFVPTPDGPKSLATNSDDDADDNAAGLIVGGARKLQKTSVFMLENKNLIIHYHFLGKFWATPIFVHNNCSNNADV